MYLHTAFGLVIESPFALPAEALYELAPTQQVDVAIICQEYLEARRYSNSHECSISGTANQIVMRWEDVGEFHLCNGEKIIIRPRPGVTEDILNLFLSGSVFALLLHQRGMTTLHGSVVALEGQGIAILAPKGVGKSTLAIAMCQYGARLVSDDIVAIATARPHPVIPHGFAQAKLWPDSLAQLGYTVDQHMKLRDEIDKRGLSVQFGEQDAVPLRHIFVLGRGRETTIQPLNVHDALFAILPHWYLARYGTATLKQLQATAPQFSQCLGLVQTIPVSLLLRPQSLAALPEVTEAIRAYLLSGAMPLSSHPEQNTRA